MAQISMEELISIREPAPAGEPVRLSESAALKVRELIGDDAPTELSLRISVSGGGCSGMQYDFAFEEGCGEDDVRFEQRGVSIVVDRVSLPLLAGAEVDFEEGLEGARFVIANPNATTTCSCGKSFGA